MKNSKEFNTIIISDIHLGSATCNAKQLLLVLKQLTFKKLILLGDIFNNLNFSRLKKEHWEVLNYLRKLSSSKRETEIIWIVGNHDLEVADILSHLVGIKVLDNYEFTLGTKKCIALHGHQFDPILSKWQFISNFFGGCYLQIQKIPWLQKGFSRWLDSITTKVQNLSEIVEQKAIKYAIQHKYDVICCGHTHVSIHTTKDGVDYYNSGSWVKQNGSYLTIDSDNNIEIVYSLC